MLFPNILMLLALTSFSEISSQRTETNPTMLCKSTGGKKLVIHRQPWTKPAAEYRGQGNQGPLPKKKSWGKVHNYCKKYIIFILRNLREFYLMKQIADLVIHLVFMEHTITIRHKDQFAFFKKKIAWSYLQESHDRNSRIAFCSSLDIG